MLLLSFSPFPLGCVDLRVRNCVTDALRDGIHEVAHPKIYTACTVHLIRRKAAWCTQTTQRGFPLGKRNDV